MSAAVRFGSDDLLIPYLNRGKYFGIEPNEWLVEEGIKQELGESLLQIKRPTFFFTDSPESIAQGESLIRFRAGPIDLQSLRTGSDQNLVVRNFAFTC